MTGSSRLPVTSALATLAATICLGPTFLRGSWFLPTLVAVLVVAAGAEATRRLATSRAVVPLGGLAALLAYLFLRYAQDQAWLWIVPTPAALDRLGALALEGRSDINRYAAPIGVSPGVEFLTVAGIGLVALAVDTAAVTWRRAALAGLPLLAVYTVPIAVAPEGVSWLAFAIGATGFLALLLAESRERLSRWGRPMLTVARRRNWTPQVETSPLSQVGRRVGATALGLALVVPAVLPDIGTGSFGFGSGGFGRGGGEGSKVAVVNPIVDLGKSLRRPDNRPVIAYRGSPTYLRLVGLDEFTGIQWRPSELQVSREDNDVEDGLSRPPGLSSNVRTTQRRYSIEIFDLKNTWLPLPYPATRVASIDGTWLYDPATFNVFGENTSTLQLTYAVRSLEVAPTAEQLRAAAPSPESMSKYLELPDDIAPAIDVRARDVAGGLNTAYDRALALQQWLRDPQEFAYDEQVGATVGDGNGSQAIMAFLESRRGYCVHFASTMAVMARLLGIPARVAVGFTEGTSDGNGRSIVSLHDAHSWPELYFQGIGWVAFEPTPAVHTGEPPSYAQPESAAGPGGPATTPTPGATNGAGAGSADAAERRRQDVLGLDAVTGGGINAGPVTVPVMPLLVGMGMLVLLSVPALTRLAVRHRRWRTAHGHSDLARAAWEELQDTLVDVGHRWRPSDTPRAGVDRLVRERRLSAEASAAAHRLAGATERARYAPVMADPGDLQADVATVWAGLLSTMGRWSQWRARLLPRSTWAVASALGERLADGLDAIDTAVAATGQRLAGRARLGRG